MKAIRILFSTALLGLTFMAYSQDYAFRVMASMGSNQVKSGGEWKALKTGSSLKANDELKLSDKAYVGLIHSGGKSIELREAGVYKVSELEQKVPNGKGAAAKYADYLANQMGPEAKKNRLSATGAVHRGQLGGADINVYMPNSVQVFKNYAIVRWDPVEAGKVTYKVVVMNMFEDVLISEETNNTFFELDLNNKMIESYPNVLLVVTTADDDNIKSETIAIKKLPSNYKTQVSSGLNDLMSGVGEETALNKYILAGFYEENNLLVDALTSYEEAIKLAPEVETYKEAYEEFLLRNGLKSGK